MHRKTLLLGGRKTITRKQRERTQQNIMVFPHTHCLWCGRVVTNGKKFCSEECEKAYENWQKKKKRFNLIYMLLVVIGFFIILILNRI